jgi:hypothetical protein
MLVELPKQIAPPPLTVAVGPPTEAMVVAGDDGQPSTVRVTLYVPLAATVELVIVGFCCAELKPFGPVQENVPFVPVADN